MPWLALGGSMLVLVVEIGLEDTTLSHCRGFISGSEGDLGSQWVFAGQEY